MPIPSGERTTNDDWVFVASNGKDPFIDLQEFAGDLRVTKEDLDKVGQFLVDKRVEETLAGFDVHGDYFHPYSPSYEKQKKQSKVDLFSNSRSGRHMVEALDWRSFPEITGRSILSVGVYGDTEVVMRARIHDQGATVTMRNRANFLTSAPVPKGRFAGKRISKVRRAVITKMYEGMYAFIPRREWMTPTQYNVDEAAGVFLRALWDRVSRKHPESSIGSPITSVQSDLRQIQTGGFDFQSEAASYSPSSYSPPSSAPVVKRYGLNDTGRF